MSKMFYDTKAFNGDISKWDVSSVTDMSNMFSHAESFNGDISKWDVSTVINMDHMFYLAFAFKQKICGDAWINSKATKTLAFAGTSGSIAQTVCTSAPTTLSERENVSPRLLPDRELIVHTPITTPRITSTIATMMTCPKCDTFKKSGRVSCCAPGGAWYKNCGGASNRNVDHSWFEGVEACKGKFRLRPSR